MKSNEKTNKSAEETDVKGGASDTDNVTALNAVLYKVGHAD